METGQYQKLSETFFSKSAVFRDWKLCCLVNGELKRDKSSPFSTDSILM